MIMTLLRVYIAIVGLMTLTLFQGHMCVKNINCKLHILDSCPLQCQLVSWCFEPSQPQRITSGLNANFVLSHSYSFHKSSYHKTCCCFFIPVFPNLYSAGTQHGNLHLAGRPILFCGSTQEPVLATANTGKTQDSFWEKNAGEWTGRVEISREEILAVSVACMAIY